MRLDLAPFASMAFLLGSLLPTAVLAGGESDAAALKDLRLGESGGVARLEIFCAQKCRALPGRHGLFILDGVSGEMVRDVSEAGTLVGLVSIEPHPIGATLEVKTVAPLSSIVIQECGPARICLDFVARDRLRTTPQNFSGFVPQVVTMNDVSVRLTHETPAIAGIDARPVSLAKQKPSVPQPQDILPQQPPQPPQRASIAAPSKPVLPQAKPVSKPKPVARPVSMTPVSTPAKSEAAELTAMLTGVAHMDGPPPPQGWDRGLVAELAGVSPGPISPAGCDLAEQVLQSSSQNMSLFAYTALCAAVRGQRAEADARLSRLTTIQPDNQNLRRAIAIIKAKPVRRRGLRGAITPSSGLRKG